MIFHDRTKMNSLAGQPRAGFCTRYDKGWRRNSRPRVPLRHKGEISVGAPRILAAPRRAEVWERQSKRTAVPQISAGFPRRLRLDCQRVHASREFPGQSRINHAVPLDPALPLEGRRHNIHSKVRLAARRMAGVALMQM